METIKQIPTTIFSEIWDNKLNKFKKTKCNYCNYNLENKYTHNINFVTYDTINDKTYHNHCKKNYDKWQKNFIEMWACIGWHAKIDIQMLG